MTCPVCLRPIGPRDGVATDGTTTVHGRCHGKHPPATADTIRFETRLHHKDHTLESLRELLERMQAGPRIENETDEQRWKRKAADMATVIAERFGGDCRNCGACPLREIEDITADIEMAVSR
jgi:hypothetical protein